MPINNDNPRGNGFVDFVLWDDNGKPLALIEAKRTSKDVEVGKHQAFLYANCLEAMHGQRPVIFYSNGYETKNDNVMYKKRVERFIQENKTHLTISKLATNQIITTNELEALENILFDGNERGTRKDFEKEYGEEPLGKFVRSILGLDVETAQQAFSDFIQTGNLEADQMTFVNNIITFLTKNGTIDKRMLFESPFTDVHDQGLLGVFDDAEAGKIVSIIDGINGNAEVG